MREASDRESDEQVPRKYTIYEDPVTHQFALIKLPAHVDRGAALPLGRARHHRAKRIRHRSRRGSAPGASRTAAVSVLITQHAGAPASRPRRTHRIMRSRWARGANHISHESYSPGASAG